MSVQPVVVMDGGNRKISTCLVLGLVGLAMFFCLGAGTLYLIFHEKIDSIMESKSNSSVDQDALAMIWSYIQNDQKEPVNSGDSGFIMDFGGNEEPNEEYEEWAIDFNSAAENGTVFEEVVDEVTQKVVLDPVNSEEVSIFFNIPPTDEELIARMRQYKASSAIKQFGTEPLGVSSFFVVDLQGSASTGPTYRDVLFKWEKVTLKIVPDTQIPALEKFSTIEGSAWIMYMFSERERVESMNNTYAYYPDGYNGEGFISPEEATVWISENVKPEIDNINVNLGIDVNFTVTLCKFTAVEDFEVGEVGPTASDFIVNIARYWELYDGGQEYWKDQEADSQAIENFLYALDNDPNAEAEARAAAVSSWAVGGASYETYVAQLVLLGFDPEHTTVNPTVRFMDKSCEEFFGEMATLTP